MPDSAQQVRAILSRTLRELDEVIAHPTVSSLLSGVGSLLGFDHADSTKAPPAQASRSSTSGPSRRSTSARGGAPAGGARTPAPAPARARGRGTPATDAAEPREATKSNSSRRDDLLALVREQPGVTLAQAATRFGLKGSSSLYSVAQRLQADGLLRKAGRELHLTAKAQKR